MRKKRQDNYENRKEERQVLMLYSLFHFVILCISIALRWEAWISIAVVLAGASCWAAYGTGAKTYHLRALYFSVMIQAVMIICAIKSEDVFSALIPYLVVVVTMGFYGEGRLLWTTVVSTTVIVLYHIFVKKTIVVDSLRDIFDIGLPVASVYLLQATVYFWAKSHNETSRKMMQVIRELEVTEKTKDEFLANVSHEIRTPINTIGGMSEIALAENNIEKMRKDIYSIQIAERNLMNVVSDILDFSELQSSKVEIEEEAYNITSTINDVISMSLALNEGKNIEFIVDCDPNIPCSLLGDEKKVRRVIMNLLNNAIKFTSKGGISLQISSRKESYGINLIIIIHDTGIGMSEETIENLFTSYNQADTSYSRRSGGIGLGLAISRALVRGMGGTITVKSQLDRGTIIKVVIPQKVLDDRPMAVVENRESANILLYVNLEQFKLRDVRDAYSTMFSNMAAQLGIRLYNCRSQAELRRCINREEYTYVLISKGEYLEDPEFYNELSKTQNLGIILEREDEKLMEGIQAAYLCKPFHVLSLVGLLNGNGGNKTISTRYKEQFVAPEAKVLVVDDNEMNIRVVEGLLSKYQIQVVAATSGKQALEIIERKDFDFVFMDQMMPEMDGIETLKQIRSKPETYYWKVPVIALTANAINGAREMLLAEGFSDFVEKPVENSVLARALLRNLPEEKIVRLDENGDVEGTKTQEKPWAEGETAGSKGQGASAEEEAFTAGDLDVKTALLYCGGMDNYKRILNDYAEKDKGNWEPIEDLYEEENWENYTIAVHAVKSTMLSIGAKPLSEMAKALEQAGKNKDLDYIRRNHDAMIAEYRRIIRQIQDAVGMEQKREEEAAEETALEQLSREAFDSYLEELENAMYDLDGERMKEIIGQMKTYAYGKLNLAEALKPIEKKIEHADYMSAVESVQKLSEQQGE